MPVRTLFVGAVAAVTVLAGAASAWAGAAAPGHDGPSNMGVCSPYLASLPAPSGTGNVRSLVNHLVLSGAFGVDTPGQLYRVRAKQHVNAAPEIECAPRR
jgi:hypothetical protein